MNVLVATVLVCLAGLFVPLSALANDTTIPCKSPPKEGASVAFHPGTQITYTQDRQNNTCTFSVNGAVATSPPANQVLDALNVFRGGGKLPPFDDVKTMASAIAALLAASAPVEKVPDELIGLIAKADKGLTRCLSEFFDKKVLPLVEFKEIRFNCKGLAPYKEAEEKAALLRQGEAAVAVPTLVISVQWQQGRFLSALYLPMTIVQMAPIR
jgi:hypothetical protein